MQPDSAPQVAPGEPNPLKKALTMMNLEHALLDEETSGSAELPPCKRPKLGAEVAQKVMSHSSRPVGGQTVTGLLK